MGKKIRRVYEMNLKTSPKAGLPRLRNLISQVQSAVLTVIFYNGRNKKHNKSCKQGEIEK